MKILRITEELQSLITSGTSVPGFRKKALVDMDKLTALGKEFSNSFPTSLHEAQEILKQKQSIVNQAYLEAQRIKTAAEEQAEEIRSATEQRATELKANAEHEYNSRIRESEIVKSAEAKSKEIQDDTAMKAQLMLREARQKASELMNNSEVTAKHHRDGADQYAREVLFNLEERMAEQLGQIRRGLDAIRSEDEIQVRDVTPNETSQTEGATEQIRQLPLLHQKTLPVDHPVSA